jgi:type I restriction enzyme S subunit
MSKLKELIQKLCPNGVEYRKLGEVCDFINGFAFKSSLFKDIGEPIIRITNINGNAVDLSNVKYFNASDYKSDLHPFAIYYGDILIAMSGATTGKIGYYCNKSTAYLNQRVGKFVPNKYILKNRYLFHFLCSKINELYIMAGGGAQPNLSSTKLMNDIVIPLPPLEVQKEIVRILDKFTTLEAELEAELTARKKQYEYYRDKLFSFNVLNCATVGNSLNNIVVMPLGEVGIFTRGSGLQKKDFTQTGVGCIHYGQIYTHYGTYANRTKTFVSQEFAKKARKAKHGDLIIATTSENDEDVCKAVAWLGDEDIAISSDACFYTHSLEPKYVAYYFQTEQFQKQKRGFITGTKVRRVNTSDLAKIKIPVPSIEEQRRIVSILDKFDMLTTSISEGLPKEIELRRKQYEYYRNQLLSFPDNKATA